MAQGQVTLVAEWRRLLRRAWSIRLALASAALSAAEFALQYLPQAAVDLIGPGRFAALAFVVSVAAAVARIVAQPRMHDGTAP
jgi:hypothetical protein